MTDAHTPRLLSEADAASDLAGLPKPGQARLVSSEEARAMAANLPHLLCAISAQEETLEQAAVMILQLANERDDGITLVFDLTSERDAIAARMAELESEVLDQCRLNGMGAERELALMSRVRELEAERDVAAETACSAVRKAFSLGQTYWQQADSEYSSQHRKADVTHATFKALVEGTRAALSTTPERKP